MFLREHREPSAGRFDVPGFVLSGAALAMIVYALSDGPRGGWSSTPVVTTAALGVMCAIAVVWFELRVERPMLHLRMRAIDAEIYAPLYGPGREQPYQR